MRKTLLVALILLMTATLLSGTISATSSEDFSDLARYFPDDSTAFIGVRTDDAMIDDIDGLIESLGTAIPEIAEEEVNVRELLDLFTLLGGFGGTFDEAIRPWLGDSVALGVNDLSDYLSLDMDMEMTTNDMMELGLPLMIAIESTNAEEATAFWSAQLETEPTEFDNFVVIDVEELDVLIGEDVILVGEMDSLIASYTGDLSPLSEYENFGATIDLLPHDDYGILAYADLTGLMESVESMMEDMQADDMMGDMDMDMAMLEDIFPTPSAMALGFVLIDDRNLVMDFAALPGENMVDSPAFSVQNPVDLTFAEHIPANAQLVVMDNNFGPEFLGVFDLLSAMSPLVQGLMEGFSGEMDMMGMGDANGMTMNLDLSEADLGMLVESLLTLAIEDLLGLNLRDDILSWMEGDYAMFISLVEVESDSELPVEVAFVTETTDADATATMIDAILVALAENEVEIPPEINLILNTNGDIFVAGIGDSAEYALSGDGESLADSDAFTYAQESLFLEDANAIWFINVAPMVELLPMMAEIAGAGDGEMMSDVEEVLGLFDSLSLTSTQADDGTAVVRMAITLNVD